MEERVVLKNCGVIDPKDIGSFMAADGFKALKKALKMPAADVVNEVKASGLRGRGGAGFPCGLKWELCAKATGDEKYVICNADEGEVGTFKDRYIIENDPFSLIEGIAIAGHAIGAKKAFIYLRAEYHFLLPLVQNAIAQSKKKAFLKHLDIEIRQGAGAYVCGEESALMDSIEGKRGEVRYRPPFPPTSGLWGKPTVINNVETLTNIPRILLNGASWFAKMGTEKSKGTKVFSVSGDVKRPGVYELELGAPLSELLKLAKAESAKAVQIGGATGRIIPYTMTGALLSFESLLGAGAVTVFGQNRDMVEIVARTMEFLAEESCGKCAPCREGTEVMVETMARFLRGEGLKKDIRVLEELAETMKLCSLCGLGQAAPIPVTDSLEHFRGEYERRIRRN